LEITKFPNPLKPKLKNITGNKKKKKKTKRQNKDNSQNEQFCYLKDLQFKLRSSISF